MSAKLERKARPYSSQLIVEDPQAFVQQLKQRLAAKEGIPENQQRLIFSVPQSVEASENASVAQPPAEEVLGELGLWQAILFKNGKAIGRLLSPQLSSRELHEEGWTQICEGAGEKKRGFVVEIISIEYDQWQPAWLKNKDLSKPLYLPVDDTFAASAYRIQVIGKSGGQSFVVPFAYTFSGRTVTAALSLEVQRADYIKGHQLLRGSSRPEGAQHLRNIAVECGRGLEGFTAVFDAEDQPAWLKSVALRFAVVARGEFDDAAPARCQQPMPVERAKQASPLEEQLDKQDSGLQKQTAAQIARDSWLPKMVIPASNSGRKTKTKQKGGKAHGHAENPKRSESATRPGGEPQRSGSTSSHGAGASDTRADVKSIASVTVEASPEVRSQGHPAVGAEEQGPAGVPERLPGQRRVSLKSRRGVSADARQPSRLQGEPQVTTRLPEPPVQESSGAPQKQIPARWQPEPPQQGGATPAPAHPQSHPPQLDLPANRLPSSLGQKPAASRQPTAASALRGELLRTPKENGVQPQPAARPSKLASGKLTRSAGSSGDRASDTASASPHPTLTSTRAPQTGSRSAAKSWGGMAGGSGDGQSGSSEGGDRREASNPSRQQGGGGGGQGGDDGDRARRWHGPQIGDDDRLRETEDETAEESPSDDSLATAVSEITPSSNTDEQQTPRIPPVRLPPSQSIAGSSSAGASFLTFGSFDSEQSVSAEEDGLPFTAAPGDAVRTPNGSTSQLEQPGSGGVVRGRPKSAGKSRTAQNSPARLRSKATGSSVSTSDLLAMQVPAEARVANGSLQGSETVPVPSQGKMQPRAPSAVPLQNGPGLTSDLQRCNLQPHDPLSMVGSPKSFSSGQPLGWAPSLTAPLQAPSGLPEETMEGSSKGIEASACFGEMATRNGNLLYDLQHPTKTLGQATPHASYLPDMSPLDGWESLQTGVHRADRLQTHSLSEADKGSAQLSSSRHFTPATSTWTPNPASRPPTEWVGAARGPSGVAPLPTHESFPQMAGPRIGDLQGRRSLPASQAHAARAAAVTSMPNEYGLTNNARADSLTQLLQGGEGISEPHSWVYEDLGFAPPLRPFSATSQRLEGAGKARSHDSAMDASARALIADLRQARAAAAAADTGMGRMGVMTPPPPPPPRTPPPGTDIDRFQAIERQGSFQVPQPVVHSAFETHGLPANDLERLMASVTPVLRLRGELAKGAATRMLRLSDVWSFYEESSSYGCEVYTHSGRRGPALAYYTPTLSALRVLLPCSSPEGEGEAAGTGYARALVQYFESELPFNREPFTNAVANLSPETGSSCSVDRWQDILLCDLHPASWFAVAWYPVYRIPDAPLTAKFLTFHSLRPQPALATYFGYLDPATAAAAIDPDQAASSPLCAPILGLKCAEQKGEQWLDPYNSSAAARSEWDVRYRQLQAEADNLSSGRHLRLLGKNGAWEQPWSTHGDLEWFNRHP